MQAREQRDAVPPERMREEDLRQARLAYFQEKIRARQLQEEVANQGFGDAEQLVVVQSTTAAAAAAAGPAR